MKLAIITDSVSRNAGGLFHSVRRLAQTLAQAGVDVQVYGVRDGRTDLDLVDWEPLVPRVFPAIGPFAFNYAPAMEREILADRPSIVQLHGLWKYTSLVTLRVSRKLRCPVIINPHGMLDPWALRNSGWKKMIAERLYERANLRRANCIRALNQSEALAVREYRFQGPVCVVPNGVDLPRYAQQSADGGKMVGSDSRLILEPSPFPPERQILLYLGRLHRKKGISELIHAWSIARQRGIPSDWGLAIAGWGDDGYEREIRRLADSLELGDSLLFLGPRFRGEKSACFRHSSGVVLPSVSEGLPNVILEAWAHAKPVIMTDQCNLPDGFAAGAAIRIESTPESIAEGIRSLVSSTAAERAAMGLRGRELVVDNYVWSKVAGQMQELYTWLLGNGTQPGNVLSE
jgi:poly(glycerol-phosphate) alpha-glucosyltransferase